MPRSTPFFVPTWPEKKQAREEELTEIIQISKKVAKVENVAPPKIRLASQIILRFLYVVFVCFLLLLLLLFLFLFVWFVLFCFVLFFVCLFVCLFVCFFFFFVLFVCVLQVFFGMEIDVFFQSTFYCFCFGKDVKFER